MRIHIKEKEKENPKIIPFVRSAPLAMEILEVLLRLNM